MALHLYNSLHKAKEVFTPEDESHVRLYVCGPTVYDRAHLGNARAMVIFDVLFRVLRSYYGENSVTYVRNITDVDDKINKASKEQNLPIDVITSKTTKAFHDDMAALHCLAPTNEPKATEHIPHMITMITRLIEKEYAYAAEGHVLFEVAKDPQYGHLSNRSLDEMIAGARVEVAPYKKSAGDFVLWKPSQPDEPGWESPWGRGRPGWHIECSAMSTHYLGANFDIHGGGADLQFPHHENEIAQSCCANEGSSYAKYWVHNGFLTVGGEKMSKSLGNFTTVEDVLQKKQLHGEVVRYALLMSHYRKPLDWNEKLISDAQKALKGFYTLLDGEKIEELLPSEAALNCLADDLSTPKLMAHMHQLAADIAKSSGTEKQHLVKALKAAGNLMGVLEEEPELFLAHGKQALTISEAEIDVLIAKRTEAKAAKNWAEADRIRDELAEKGVVLKDSADGTNWSKR